MKAEARLANRAQRVPEAASNLGTRRAEELLNGWGRSRGGRMTEPQMEALMVLMKPSISTLRLGSLPLSVPCNTIVSQKCTGNSKSWGYTAVCPPGADMEKDSASLSSQKWLPLVSSGRFHMFGAGD